MLQLKHFIIKIELLYIINFFANRENFDDTLKQRVTAPNIMP